MAKQTVSDLNVEGKKVLVRVDFNVPQTASGEVADDRRIRAALPTLKDILLRGGSLILVSHLGRPTGDPAADAPFRMDHVAARLQELIHRPVQKTADTVGPEAQAACAALKPGGIVVLENVRFNKGEKKGDVRVRQANGRSGRCLRQRCLRHLSPRRGLDGRGPRTVSPEDRGIGFLVEKELQILDTLLSKPKSPYVAVMGGAKVSDKILVIENLLKKVDKLLVGGAMTYTFLKAQGHEVGKSRVEADKLDVARHVLELAGSKLVLPVDHLIADQTRSRSRNEDRRWADHPGWLVRHGHRPQDDRRFTRRIIKDAGTVIWNGPMGMFEVEAFAAGTKAVAQALADSSGRDRRGRGRVGRGGREVRTGREGQPRLHRRRRVPGIARGQELQFSEGDSGSLSSCADSQERCRMTQSRPGRS